MCLGIPGKIIDIYPSGTLKMAKVSFDGVIREACLEMVPEARVGDYTVIHVGFAISLLDESEAIRTLDLLKEMDMLSQEGIDGN
jgi:hydrogenase expression/formation protein HypC